MRWLYDLIFSDSTAHAILVYSIIIVAGVWLGRFKVFGISLGITFVLFAGIISGHFRLTASSEINDFIRDFGLILFVFSIGLQVGPSFFSSFRKGGISFNILAVTIIILGSLTTIGIHFLTGTPISLLAGIMSGAVTNTPGLGAAQQALAQTAGNASVPEISLGYAVTYPFGVIGVILTLVLIRKMFRIDIRKELELYLQHQHPAESLPEKISIIIRERRIFNRSIREITGMIRYEFIISRIMRNGKIMPASSDALLQENDIVLVVTQRKFIPEVLSLMGERSRTDISASTCPVSVRHVIVTNRRVHGKMLSELKIRTRYNVTVTRVYRAGIEFVAVPGLRLQLGDKLTTVGDELSIESLAGMLGNSVRRLDEPNLIPIFLGIFLGVILGSLPIHIPGVVRPLSLGLAGGPLVVAILLSSFGHKLSIASYTTPSANLMLRETGIVLFLASVGMKAGENFIPSFKSGDGFIWMGYGAVITLLPILVVGIFARRRLKTNYLLLCGLLAGSMTDPPALAYSNSLTESDAPAVAYATIYPLVMFLRILVAQMLILLLAT